MGSSRNRASAFSLFAFQDIITSVTGIMVFVTLMLALELLNRVQNAPPIKTAEVLTQLDTAIQTTEARVRTLEERREASQDRLNRLAGVRPDTIRNNLRNLRSLTLELEKDIANLGLDYSSAQKRLEDARAYRSQHDNDERKLGALMIEAKRLREEIERLKRTGRIIFTPRADNTKTPWLVQIASGEVLTARYGSQTPAKVFRSAHDFVRFACNKDPAKEYFVVFVKSNGVDLFTPIRAQLEGGNFGVAVFLLADGQSAIDTGSGAMP